MKEKYFMPSFKIKNFRLDVPLLGLLFLLIIFGLLILYSASNENPIVLNRQILRIFLASIIMILFSIIPPHKYKEWSPGLYLTGLLLLIAVMVMGKIGKGAQRWLDFKIIKFQPSEIMKLAVPMMTAWFYSNVRQTATTKNFIIASIIVFVPTLLIAKQPDLGTAIMVASAGFAVIFLAGMSLKLFMTLSVSSALVLPVIWHHLHSYQKKRIFTLFNPELDPLGAGYHTIQSKIAIGSGGSYGKGWLQGSQSHLNFLPEHTTDFIFAVNGEEFGFIGGVILIILILAITLRGLYIAHNAPTRFSKLLTASLSSSFFLSGFVNIGMVMGLLPVVGVPLPLISYGGTALLTFMAGFGIIMSISSRN